MEKKLILIEDKEDVANSISLYFTTKGFDTIKIDSSETSKEEIADLLADVSGEVVIVSDYNDEIFGGSFAGVAAEVVKKLRDKKINYFFVANSANTNTDLVREISGILGEDFKADLIEPNKRARPIFEGYVKSKENRENKRLA